MPLGIWQSMAYFCHPVSASELCFYPHIKMKPACFECSFGRSLAPDADSERSWLPRGLILPVTHACPSTNCLGNWGLFFWERYSSKHKQGCWNDPSIAWGEQESLPGSTVRVEAARAAPGLSISLVLLEEPPGFAVSQAGQETQGSSAFTFTLCLLFWTNTAERRFVENKPL